MACAPKVMGPTDAGHFVLVRTSHPVIYLRLSSSTRFPEYPGKAEVLGRAARKPPTDFWRRVLALERDVGGHCFAQPDLLSIGLSGGQGEVRLMTARRAYLIGIDIGTSACKTLLIDETGDIVARHVSSYALETPRPGWAEQDPEHWWGAVEEGLQTVVAACDSPSSIKGIGLSGQMHGLVALDQAGGVLRPAILWNDQRTGAQCDRILATVGDLNGLLALTNNQMLTGYTAGKILWLREHEPDCYERMALFLNPKDYIRLRLTGERATEVSDASGTGLFDVRARCWSRSLLEQLDIPDTVVPACFESHEVSGQLRHGVADRLGLPRQLPVVGGGGDAVIQTTGSGLIDPGPVQTIIGTAGIAACTLDFCPDNHGGRLQIFCHTAPDRWHCMGVSLSAGAAFGWLRDILSETGTRPLSYDALTELAATVPAGCEGLFFLPYLMGERCPYPDPDAKGAFIGLTLRHNRAHMVRSVMEGVVYSLRDVVALMEALGVVAQEIHTSGGGAVSPLWRQMQADVFGCDLLTVSGATEGGALGAAFVAGVGVGIWPGIEACIARMRIATRDHPVPSDRAVYASTYAVYRDFYAILKPQFDRIAALSI